MGLPPSRSVSLKDLAAHLKLSPATVSLVINEAPGAKAIPKETQDRIFQAAQELKYRPNFFARSLRQKRTFTVGVIVPEISEGYAASILSGIEDKLMREGYFYLVASHRGKPDLIEECPRLLAERAVEGFLLINTPLQHGFNVPAIAIPGHTHLENVTNILLDHRKAAWVAMEHLANLGHDRIAVFKGHPKSGDTEARWQGIAEAAQRLGLKLDPNLILELPGADWETYDPMGGYAEGYRFGQKLLARKCHFTALFAFNDISAMGAIRAFHDAGLKVPHDVSVVGFDDISSAAFLNPRLTTVRQPLRHMGELAAMTLLRRLASDAAIEEDIYIEPELMVRESTSPVRRGAAMPRTATKAAR